MKTLRVFSVLILISLIIPACQTQPTESAPPTSPPSAPDNTATLPAPTATEQPSPTVPPATATATEVPLPPTPTPFTTANWSTAASTGDELSFAFPGNWDGSSPLTFGEGEFVKDPDQPLGVTFQIELSGNPESLLNNWGTKDVGIIGIVTFTPETVSDGANVTIARVDAPTKIARGNGITAQVAYIQRAKDVMEVMWFAPSDQWEALQPVFQGVLENVEIWREYTSNTYGLHTMYMHDWLTPQATWEGAGLWFRSADERTGLAMLVKNEIADPVQLLQGWSTERLAPLDLSNCTIDEGDRMDTMSGQWESSSGECSNANGEKITYEISFVPDKDRLLEIITYAPSDTWDDANARAFKHLLGMMVDIRP